MVESYGRVALATSKRNLVQAQPVRLLLSSLCLLEALGRAVGTLSTDRRPKVGRLCPFGHLLAAGSLANVLGNRGGRVLLEIERA